MAEDESRRISRRLKITKKEAANHANRDALDSLFFIDTEVKCL